MRPKSIKEVERHVEALARYGGVRSDIPYSTWLLLTGAVQSRPEGPWLFTDENWLAGATPASGPLDLLHRTAVRDPQYRFHLDVLLAQVLQAIGTAARWSRFEELLCGPLKSFAPRFVQLLHHATIETQTKPNDLSPSSWQRLTEQVEGGALATFHSWDCDLWGDVPGGPAAIFPLLVELYIPLRRQASNVAPREQGLDDSSARLLAALIERSRNAEGIPFDASLEPRLKALLNLGLPLRRWPASDANADRRALVGLVEPVRLVWEGSIEGYSDGIPMTAVDKGWLKDACHVVAHATDPGALAEGFWTATERSISAVAFPGLSLAEDWPANPPQTPAFVQVPAATSLRGIDAVRKDSLEVDQALFDLARHLLFGLLLQVLLLESLDRELGQDSLALTPVSEEGVGGFEGIRVFYRPASDLAPETERTRASAYDLGAFDSVIDSIASELGISAAGLTFDAEGRGFWSAAMKLLGSLGLVALSSSRDRWILRDDYLDRLHGGGLMAGVLRRGKGVRDRIRVHLHHLWAAADEMNQKRGESDA